MTNHFGKNIIPENEAERIKALYRYKILDSFPEPAFDRIAQTVRQVFETPIALISFVDDVRVFFKANVGMEGVTNVERGLSLCSLAILSDEVTVFKNALKEPCLLANPLITGTFGLRFYAGAPIITPEGMNIGTLCIVGKEPRDFSKSQEAILANFASLVTDVLDMRNTKLHDEETLRDIFDVTHRSIAPLKELLTDKEHKAEMETAIKLMESSLERRMKRRSNDLVLSPTSLKKIMECVIYKNNSDAFIKGNKVSSSIKDDMIMQMDSAELYNCLDTFVKEALEIIPRGNKLSVVGIKEKGKAKIQMQGFDGRELLSHIEEKHFFRLKMIEIHDGSVDLADSNSIEINFPLVIL